VGNRAAFLSTKHEKREKPGFLEAVLCGRTTGTRWRKLWDDECDDRLGRSSPRVTPNIRRLLMDLAEFLVPSGFVRWAGSGTSASNYAAAWSYVSGGDNSDHLQSLSHRKHLTGDKIVHHQGLSKGCEVYYWFWSLAALNPQRGVSDIPLSLAFGASEGLIDILWLQIPLCQGNLSARVTIRLRDVYIRSRRMPTSEIPVTLRAVTSQSELSLDTYPSEFMSDNISRTLIHSELSIEPTLLNTRDPVYGTGIQWTRLAE
jgi:hypothetical protein